MDLGLADAATVVVGGSRGMGLATASCLADEGARVAVAGRSQAALDGAVEELTARRSPATLAVAADIRQGASVGRVFAELGQPACRTKSGPLSRFWRHGATRT